MVLLHVSADVFNRVEAFHRNSFPVSLLLEIQVYTLMDYSYLFNIGHLPPQLLYK